MGVYGLGADDRVAPPPMVPNAERARLAAAGDMRYVGMPAMVPVRDKSPAGAASVQVHRAISARANRTLGDDGQLEGFSLKGIAKGVANVAKAAVKPAVSVAAAVGLPLASQADRLINKPKPATPAPANAGGPPPMAQSRPVRALPKKPTPVVVAKPVKVAPDLTLRPGAQRPAAVTKKEAGTLAQLSKDVAELKTGAATAKDAHDTAQKAKAASKTLNARSQRLAANARSIAAKAKAAADAGDAAGASKLAEQARTIEAVAQNTATMATQAGNYAERAGNAIAAGTDAALAAGATNSEGFGGIVAKIQANPLLALGGAAVLAFAASKLLGGKKRAA